MLCGAMAFNQEIKSWDTSKITDMSHMFNAATSLLSWDGSIYILLQGKLGGKKTI
jgi:surface protein